MGYAKKNKGASQQKAAREVSAASPQKKEKAASIWQMQIGGTKRATVMKRVEVLLFTSELADLIEAGMTLGQALSALARQGAEGSAQKYVCQDLCDRIVRGETFSDACKHHPKTFPAIYSNMIRAGEASGAMIEVLRRLVEHYERDDNMRAKIKSAMSYPIIVLCFGIIAVIGAMVWIVPQFSKIFDKLGGALPLPTRMLVGMSEFTIQYGWLLLIGSVLFTLWFRKWKAGGSGRRRVDGWKLKMPLVSGIVATGAYSSLAYTMKTLLSNGVNVLQALKICEDVCGNAVIGDALRTARMKVTDGTTISGPLAESGAFPRMMTDMLAVGEQAGDLAGSLEHIGKRYQKDMERNIAVFSNALEPILIVLIACVVGFVAIAILTAVNAMNSQFS